MSQTVLWTSFEGKKFNSPNDLVFKSDGALYFTDLRTAYSSRMTIPRNNSSSMAFSATQTVS